LLALPAAAADISLGLITSMTGPGASIGIPYSKGTAAGEVYKDDVNGIKIKVQQLDDASDPSTGTRDARKLIEQDNVDVLMGAGNTPITLAIAAVSREQKVPLIALVSGLSIMVAAATVVFRDVEHLLVTVLLPWFFVTPVFYTFDQLPKIDQRPWVADILHYGNFITLVISFLIVACCIFLVVKAMNKMKRPAPDAPAVSKDCPACAMTIPIKARRCPHCTTELSSDASSQTPAEGVS